MGNAIGIRREDKNQWERRAPLTPSHVKRLIQEHGAAIYIQPSARRVFPEDAYREAGAIVQEDLSPCNVILGIKEIPLDQFERGKTYLFFSHTIKGQPYNMPMLKRMMESECRLIDYERIVDGQGRRLVLFGRHAGLAGMIESLHALGRRLSAEGVEDSCNPFIALKQPFEYANLGEAKSALDGLGKDIARNGLPAIVTPLVVGFLGYGNVSKGAQEILDCLPVEEIKPEKLFSLGAGPHSNKVLYKAVFREEDTVETVDGSKPFVLEHYYAHPEQYRATFSRYLPHISILINGVYWDERYPVLVTCDAVKELYSEAGDGNRPKLRVIGDITCDIEGSIAMTREGTLPDQPCYVYDPTVDRIEYGCGNLRGPIIMAVEILPTEFPVESSDHFGDSLLPFLPALATADPGPGFAESSLPGPLRAALILNRGKLTESYRYLEKFVR